MVRAKFKIDFMSESPDNGGKIVLVPVIDDTEENKKFFKYTPAGIIELQIVNPATLAKFDVDKEYYVDFTPA